MFRKTFLLLIIILVLSLEIKLVKCIFWVQNIV